MTIVMETVKLAVDVSEEFRQALREFSLSVNKTMGELIEDILSGNQEFNQFQKEFADVLRRVRDRKNPKRKT